MALTRLGGANAITGTIPQGNIANASLNSVTALPAAVPVGSFTLISTSNVTSSVSQVDITSGIDNTYSKYFISITNLHPSGDATMRMRFFTGSGGSQAVNSGSNYRTSMIGFRNDRSSEISHGSSGADNMDAFSTQNIGGAEANESFSATMFLVNPSSTTYDTMLHGEFSEVDDAARICHGIFSCRYTDTGNAITGLRFYVSSGTIDNAIIKLYGIS